MVPVIPAPPIVPPAQLTVPSTPTLALPVRVPPLRFKTPVDAIPTALSIVRICPAFASVCVPLAPPSLRSTTVASTSSVTVYVPSRVITAVSAAVGGVPVLQLAPSLQLPLAGFVHNTPGTVDTTSRVSTVVSQMVSSAIPPPTSRPLIVLNVPDRVAYPRTLKELLRLGVKPIVMSNVPATPKLPDTSSIS